VETAVSKINAKQADACSCLRGQSRPGDPLPRTIVAGLRGRSVRPRRLLARGLGAEAGR